MAEVLTATGLVVVLVVGYAAACAFWPYTRCPKCTGTGKRDSPSGRYFRDCRRCKGSGRRMRTGRRVFNFLHARHREGVR